MLKPCRVVTRLFLEIYWPEKNENIPLETVYLTKPNTLTNGLYIPEKNAEKSDPWRATWENTQNKLAAKITRLPLTHCEILRYAKEPEGM